MRMMPRALTVCFCAASLLAPTAFAAGENIEIKSLPEIQSIISAPDKAVIKALEERAAIEALKERAAIEALEELRATNSRPQKYYGAHEDILGIKTQLFPDHFRDKPIAPVTTVNNLILIRIELLEKKLDLLEARMGQLQKGGK